MAVRLEKIPPSATEKFILNRIGQVFWGGNDVDIPGYFSHRSFPIYCNSILGFKLPIIIVIQ